jgi:hypothetical protein
LLPPAETNAAFYTKWIAAVNEHIQHVQTSPLWMSDFQTLYGANIPALTNAVLQTHVNAYHKSRFYHMTRPGNVASILHAGLDPTYGGTKLGLSEAHPDRDTGERYKQSSRGYVHLGKNWWSIQSMEQTLRDKYPNEAPQYLRAFLDEEDWENLQIDRDVALGAVNVAEAGAVKTMQAIPAAVIYAGRFDALPLDKQLAIAQRIRDHYPLRNPAPMWLCRSTWRRCNRGASTPRTPTRTVQVVRCPGAFRPNG